MCVYITWLVCASGARVMCVCITWLIRASSDWAMRKDPAAVTQKFCQGSFLETYLCLIFASQLRESFIELYLCVMCASQLYLCLIFASQLRESFIKMYLCVMFASQPCQDSFIEMYVCVMCAWQLRDWSIEICLCVMCESQLFQASFIETYFSSKRIFVSCVLYNCATIHCLKFVCMSWAIPSYCIKDGHLPSERGKETWDFQRICTRFVAPRDQCLGERQRCTAWWARHSEDTANDHLVQTCLY